MSILEINRVIQASIDEVFAALTDDAIMAQWFFHEPGGSAEITMDPVVGGSYSIAMKSSSGSELTATGEFLEVLPPRRLVFTWSTYLISNATVTIELEERGIATGLTLRHDLPPDLHGPHRVAWEAVLNNLDDLLA